MILPSLTTCSRYNSNAARDTHRQEPRSSFSAGWGLGFGLLRQSLDVPFCKHTPPSYFQYTSLTHRILTLDLVYKALEQHGLPENVEQTPHRPSSRHHELRARPSPAHRRAAGPRATQQPTYRDRGITYGP